MICFDQTKSPGTGIKPRLQYSVWDDFKRPDALPPHTRDRSRNTWCMHQRFAGWHLKISNVSHRRLALLFAYNKNYLQINCDVFIKTSQGARHRYQVVFVADYCTRGFNFPLSNDPYYLFGIVSITVSFLINIWLGCYRYLVITCLVSNFHL